MVSLLQLDELTWTKSMAIFGNFKGTTQSDFSIGKNDTGSKISTGTQPSSDISNGDLYIDSSNSTLQVYNGNWVSVGSTLTDLNVDSGTLYVDSSNDTVSVGSTSSNDKLFVNGSLRLGTNPSLKHSGAYLDVQHSNGSATQLRLRDNSSGSDPIFKIYNANNTSEVFKVQGDTTTFSGNATLTGIDTLRINENGTGLRMTNVGAFDNSGGDFRIFSTSNLILATDGENGTAVTFDQNTKDAVFQGNVTVNNAYTLPSADGTAGQFLQTDGSGGVTFSSEFTDLSITGTATYNTVEFQNSNIMKFNQRYTGGSSGSYFSNGEYQKVVTIIPSGASQNYQVVGRMTAQNAGETHTVYFNAALRSNTLPDLDWTITYDEEYNGGRYLDPQLWTKETTTAGFIFAFKTLATIYGSVTIDMEVIPRASSQKDNVTVNTVVDSEQASVEAGYTAHDMVLVTRKQGTTLSVKDVSITGNIVPTANVTYDLGTSSNRFKDLYLSGNTINLGTTSISVTSDNEIDFSDSANTSVKRKLVVDEIELGTGNDKVVLRKGSNGKFEQKALAKDTNSESAVKVDLDDNDTDDLSEGSTNLYYTDARVNTLLATKDSDDTKEGSTNLYYTTARANSAIDAKLTGDITLGNVTSQSVNTGVVEGVVFQPITDYGSITSTANITIDYGAVNEAGTVPAIGDFEYISDIFGPTGDSYKVDGLPSAAQPGQMIYVSDETGGSVMAFSDGSNWRRITDRAVVS